MSAGLFANGAGRRLRVGGSHFDVAARTISNRVPLATAAMEEFLSAGHAATDGGADRGGGQIFAVLSLSGLSSLW